MPWSFYISAHVFFFFLSSFLLYVMTCKPWEGQTYMEG
uniref:Uncharacterized protein n=1 Tax=Rhizophora mucronata TaxID=61149 RepID=A0A2P2QMB6_RHIMU